MVSKVRRVRVPFCWPVPPNPASPTRVGSILVFFSGPEGVIAHVIEAQSEIQGTDLKNPSRSPKRGYIVGGLEELNGDSGGRGGGVGGEGQPTYVQGAFSLLAANTFKC